MPVHSNDDCSCHYVEPWFTHQEQFARVDDVFHMVTHISDDEHIIPCEGLDEDFDELLHIPSDIFHINCVNCLKLHIVELRNRLRLVTNNADDLPF